ncbi:hypothetical protein KKG83_04355 [Candidatus Micrarchaeota archaeon]|nr:hypothetical protein [Candidatus Micrarchaeota archaeon]MBU2476677.1 hypothetical protein [Candidatus Micrarchaeota archaeon]
MPKDEAPKKKSKSFFPSTMLVIFIAGLVLGVLIQFFFIQPLMDNSDSYKSKLAECKTSSKTCDNEIKTYFSCMQENALNPNDCT